MDLFDLVQLEQSISNKRLISESASLEQAKLATKHTHRFEEGIVTQEDIEEEMQYTIENCTPCVRKEFE